jgi:nucleolar protein 56
MYLITKWFGIFLIDKKNKIIKKYLFKNNHENISKKLNQIENNNILIEEKKIIKGFKKDEIISNQKRLKNLVNYQPNEIFFKKLKINYKDFNFSINNLKIATINNTNNKLTKEFKLKDHQIIQMVKSLDSLISIHNLLSERLENWLIINTPKYKIEPFKKLIKNIKKEISRLESQIKNDIQKIAPNSCNIIGPIITARMISLAGNMNNLSKMPASTIQILGAENAFFRYKKEGGKNPKHGIIFQNNMINQAPKKHRGKISRVIASKLSIAIKADYYTKRDISKDLIKEIHKKLNELKN